MSLYTKILKQSLKITWRYKYLWFFGLFATFLINNGAFRVYDLVFQDGPNFFAKWQRIQGTGMFHGNFFKNIGQSFAADPFSVAIIIVFSLIFLALALFLVWLSVVSQAGIIHTALAVEKKEIKKVTFSKSLAVGSQKFWTIFGLNLVIKIFSWLAFVCVSALIFVNSIKLATSLYIASFFIFVPLIVIVSFVIRFAIVNVVKKSEGLVDSLRYAFSLFMENWLVSLEMAFTLFFLTLVAGLSILFLSLILAIPFLALAYAAYALAPIAVFWFIVIFGTSLLVALIILAGSILTVFQVSAWTCLFVQLDSHGGLSKLERIFSHLRKKFSK